MLRPPDRSLPVQSHYSRLFGGPFAGHDETHLRELSTRMKDIPLNRSGRPRLSSELRCTLPSYHLGYSIFSWVSFSWLFVCWLGYRPVLALLERFSTRSF